MDTTETDSKIETPEPAPPEAPALFLRTLTHQAKPQMRWVMFSALLATIGTIAFSAGIALIIGGLVTQTAPLWWYWALAVVGVCLRLLANLWKDRIGQVVSATTRASLREDLLAKASADGPAKLYQQGNAAWWSQRHLEQVDALHGYLAKYLPARYTVTVTPLLLIMVTIALDWVAGLLLLLATPIIPIFMALIGWGTEAVHRTQQSQQAALASHLLDRLQALPWLRRQRALEQTAQGVETAAEEYRRISMRVLRVAFLSSATLEFFSALSIGLMAIYIGFCLYGMLDWAPGNGMHLTPGLFMLLLAPECFLPLRQLAQSHHDMNAAKASAQSLAHVLGPTPADNAIRIKGIESDFNRERAIESPLAADKHHPTLSLQHVNLTWPGQERGVLVSINLEVLPAEVIGLGGDSGAGKSTLLNIMAGFLKPDSGTVTRTDQFAWMQQQTHLFHDTLRANLQMACCADQSDDALVKALEHAGINLPNPMLPDGLDTLIGETNQGVSGGQAQRIALTRAVLSQAPLWLLDEPTAALDDETRDGLIKTLLTYSRRHHISVVISSHDPVLLSHCDRVLRLKEGQLMASTL